MNGLFASVWPNRKNVTTGIYFQKQMLFFSGYFHSDKVSYSNYKNILKERNFPTYLPNYMYVQHPWVWIRQANILLKMALSWQYYNFLF
jgi:hypothetical protein